MNKFSFVSINFKECGCYLWTYKLVALTLITFTQSDDPEHQRRVEELNKRLLAQKLEWQAKQSEEDAKWLQAEELNMV